MKILVGAIPGPNGPGLVNYWPVGPLEEPHVVINAKSADTPADMPIIYQSSSPTYAPRGAGKLLCTRNAVTNSNSSSTDAANISQRPITANVVVLKRLLAVSLLALVAGTWKLWTPQTVFPQIPLLRFACNLPGWCDWVCLSALIIASFMLLVFAKNRRVSRVATGVISVSLAGFFVLNQHRLQPWAWQFFLLSILLTLADDTTVRKAWIWLAISIYFWSAISKMDYSFFNGLGPALLGGLKQAAGLQGGENPWTRTFDVCGAMLFVAGEFGVAVLLMYSRTRWLGLWGAIGMHLTLLAALGPFGLNHSPGVLLWNLYFIAQDWFLFRPVGKNNSIDAETRSPSTISRLMFLCWPAGRANRVATIVILAAIGWPSLESIGRCDHWLAWSVYSARPHQAILRSALPFDCKPLQIPYYEETVWDLYAPDEPNASIHHTSRILNIFQWSRDQLSVPVYPQARFYVGIARALASEHQLQGELELIPVAARWNGERPEGVGLHTQVDPSLPDELEKFSETYFWNTRPRRMPRANAFLKLERM